MVLYGSASKINQSETTLEYFDPLETHKYHTHTHTPCVMMDEVSLETSPKNIMIQDMINSETVQKIKFLYGLNDLTITIKTLLYSHSKLKCDPHEKLSFCTE